MSRKLWWDEKMDVVSPRWISILEYLKLKNHRNCNFLWEVHPWCLPCLRRITPCWRRMSEEISILYSIMIMRSGFCCVAIFPSAQGEIKCFKHLCYSRPLLFQLRISESFSYVDRSDWNWWSDGDSISDFKRLDLKLRDGSETHHAIIMGSQAFTPISPLHAWHTFFGFEVNKKATHVKN